MDQDWSHEQRQPELSQGFAEWGSASRPHPGTHRDSHPRAAAASQAHDWAAEQHPTRQPMDFHPTADYSASLTGTDWSYHPRTSQQRHMDHHEAERPRNYGPAEQSMRHHSAGHRSSGDRSHVGPGLRQGEGVMNGSRRVPTTGPMSWTGSRGRPDQHRGEPPRQAAASHMPESRHGCSKR